MFTKNKKSKQLSLLLVVLLNYWQRLVYEKQNSVGYYDFIYSVSIFFISTIRIVLLFWHYRLRKTTLFDIAPNQTYNTFR